MKTALHKITISIGDLFSFLNIDNELYEKPQYSDKNIYIKSINDDIVPILGYVKKRVNLNKYYIKNNDISLTLICSDKHLVLNENFQTVKISDTSIIQNKFYGAMKIYDHCFLNEGDAYDIAIPDPHLYCTSNGIIHHNTSIARILTDGYDVLKLNGSSENGIDIIRNQVVSFASQISLELGAEKMKVIYIDEADGLSSAAWDALRETIEHYASSVRYICTCNKIDKIPAPIRSRFNCVPLYPINKQEEEYIFSQYCEYVGKILTGIKISYDQDTLREFVKTNFPDMRSILNTLQTLHTQGATELDKSSLIKTFDCSDLYELILQDNSPEDNYKFIMANYSSSPDEALLAISQSFIDFLRTNYSQYNAKIPLLIIAIAEYVNELNSSPDQVIVLLACCFKLQMIIHS